MDLALTICCIVFVWAMKKIWCIVSFLKIIYRSLCLKIGSFHIVISACYYQVRKVIRFKNILIRTDRSETLVDKQR